MKCIKCEDVISHCLYCINATECIKCKDNRFLTVDFTSCVDDCSIYDFHTYGFLIIFSLIKFFKKKFIQREFLF